MYHYIRDVHKTAFPRIKGMLTEVFRRQLTLLQDRYEMATLESALEFVRGRYSPRRDLCLLTFDDGLKEHYAEVMPLLIEHHVQGIFFPITACLENERVVPVHMNHFLMAAYGVESYREMFAERLTELFPEVQADESIDKVVLKRTYRWDVSEVARFKYLINYVLEPAVRDPVIRSLFEERLGPEQDFARTLYFNWDEAREMQAAGMIVGGHSHQHLPLTRQSPEDDLRRCRDLLHDRLDPQAMWPFSYPYGTKHSDNGTTSTCLRQLGFTCAFTTQAGPITSGADPFDLHRLDCNDVPMS